MNARGRCRRAWGAALLGVLAFLPFSAHGQAISLSVHSPSEIWRDQLDGARVRLTTNLAGGIRTGADVVVRAEGAPSGLTLGATLAWGGDPAAVDISITGGTSGTYTAEWLLRIWVNSRGMGSPNPIWARTTSNGVWVRTKNEKHIDVDAEPSTASENPGPLWLAEGHATLASKEYTVKLSAVPTADVTVTVTSGDPGTLTVDTNVRQSGLQGALTFTTENWNTAQTVTASAVDDADFAGGSVSITHTASGGGYISSPHTEFTLEAQVADDEAAQLVVDANPSTTTVVDAGPLVLNEDTARTGNFSVKLSREPTGTTTVSLASDNGAVTLSASALTFTTTNWDSAQTVTATTTQDTDAADEAADVTHTASGGGYDGISATLRVGVTDDERTGMTTTPTRTG